MGRYYLIIILLILVFLIIVISAYLKYYKKCPPGHIMVIYLSKPDNFGNMTRIISSGGAFIWPILGSFQLFSLEPYILDLKLQNLKSLDKKALDIEMKIIFGISTSEMVIQRALERISGLSREKVNQIAEDIITAQTRLTITNIKSIETEELDRFKDIILNGIVGELSEIGLMIISVDIISVEIH